MNEEQRLERLRALYELQRTSGEETGAIDAELIFDLLGGLRAHRAQLAKTITLEILPDPGQLPERAGPREFFRVAGDPALYIGNGPARPLTKLEPTSL